MKDNSDNIYVLYRHIKNYMVSGYISFKKKYPKLKKVLLKHGLPLVTKNSDIAKIKFDNKSYYLYIDEAPFIDEEPKSKPHNLMIRWQFGDNITENDIIYSVTEISKMIHNIMICNMI